MYRTLARIIVAFLLMLLSWPVVYLGLLGIYALFRLDDAISVHLVLPILTPVFAVLSAFGTLFAFRYAPMTAGALAMFYLGWAFTVYPFPGVLPHTTFHWIYGAVFAILCLNLAWTTWSLRGIRRR